MTHRNALCPDTTLDHQRRLETLEPAIEGVLSSLGVRQETPRNTNSDTGGQEVGSSNLPSPTERNPCNCRGSDSFQPISSTLRVASNSSKL